MLWYNNTSFNSINIEPFYFRFCRNEFCPRQQTPEITNIPTLSSTCSRIFLKVGSCKSLTEPLETNTLFSAAFSINSFWVSTEFDYSSLHFKIFSHPGFTFDYATKRWTERRWSGVITKELKHFPEIVSIIDAPSPKLSAVIIVSLNECWPLLSRKLPVNFITTVICVSPLRINQAPIFSLNNPPTITSELCPSLSDFIELYDFTWLSFDLVPRRPSP